MEVLAVALKGIAIAQALIEQGQPAVQALTAIYNLLSKQKDGTVSDQDIANTRTTLDQLIEDFNVEIEE